MDPLFGQLTALGASLALLFALMLLWRRGLDAYTSAFAWQSLVLSVLAAVVGYFGNAPELYAVAAAFFLLKVVFIPRVLRRMRERFGSQREDDPFVDTATSLVVGGLLVLFSYVVTRPLVLLGELPTRAGIPLAMAIVFIGLFVVISRKKAVTQIVGFLVMENGIALMAILGTYGIPFIVELGVFLDVMLGFWVMHVFVYNIDRTFEHIDVEQLDSLTDLTIRPTSPEVVHPTD
jgi:hydrogenase-4 component E